MQPASSSSNSLEQRVATMQRNMDSFFKLASTGDASLVYRSMGKNGIWSGKSPSEIVSAVENLLVEVPAARECIIYFLGGLIHESTHFHLSRRENPTIGVDTSNLNEAVKVLVGKLRTLLRQFNTISFTLELFTPILPLLVEIGIQNNGRPSMGGRKGSTQLHELLSQCPGVISLLDLLDDCLHLLLQQAPDQAINALSTGLPNIDNWVWHHIINTFPADLVPYLLEKGLEEFKAYSAEIIQSNPLRPNLLLQDEYSVKFRSLCELLTYFGDVKKSFILKSRLREMIERFSNEVSSGVDDEAMFILKLFLMSPSLLLFMKEDLFRHVSTRSFTRIILLASTPTAKTLLSGRPLMRTFALGLMPHMSLNQLYLTVEALSPIVFDDENVILADLTPQSRRDIKDTLSSILGI